MKGKSEITSRKPIGFEIQGRSLPIIQHQAVPVLEATEVHPEVESLMVEIGAKYVELRSTHGVKEHADFELAKMFDKLFIRHFDKIV